MAIGQLTVKSRKNENLSSLYREIETKFPNIDQFVDKFSINEKRGRFFAAGDPIVKEIELVWHVPDPDSEAFKVIQQVIELIQSSGKGDVKLDYDT